MRKKIAHVILLILSICVLAGMFSGCGREVKPENAESEAEESELPDGTEKDYLMIQEELRPSILQIHCGDYRGSGVVWEITEEEVTVVSSGHLLKNGETCEVLCYTGVYYEAKVDRILEDCDIGFAVFPAEALKEDGVALTPAIPTKRDREELIRGEELVVYGSMDYVAGNFVKGYLIEAENDMQLEGYDSAQPLMLGGIVLEKGKEDEMSSGESGEDADILEKGMVDSGMSGSGVFDRQGKLLGILAGGDGERGFVAVPVWRIE